MSLTKVWAWFGLFLLGLTCLFRVTLLAAVLNVYLRTVDAGLLLALVSGVVLAKRPVQAYLNGHRQKLKNVFPEGRSCIIGCQTDDEVMDEVRRSLRGR